MVYSSRLTTKGQATIPKPVRDFLGLAPHDPVSFEITDGAVLVRSGKTTVLDFKGFLRAKSPVRDLATVREEVKRRVASRAAEGRGA